MLKMKVLVFLTGFCALGVVFAQSPDAFMIVTNPGEDSSVEMRISWHTDLGVDGSFVECTKKSDASWANARKIVGEHEVSTAFDGVMSIVSSTQGNFKQDIKFNHYKAVLSKLEPNTEYMYRVGKNVLSDTMHFKTAGTGEWTFVWVGDYHAYDPLPQRLNTAMDMIRTLITANQGNVDFIFSTGDDVAYGGSYTYWKNLFAREYFRNYMWVTLIGNHDHMDRTNSDNRDDYYLAMHNNPPNGYAGQEGASYWFKYGNVLWIVFNSMELTNAAKISKSQEWAAKVIRQNPVQYIFVAQHYQWFNGITGNYNSAGFTQWNAFFDK